MNTKSLFYLTLAVVWLAHFLVDMMIGILPVYKTIVGLDLALIGIISGTCAFIGEGLQMVFGSLSDKGYTKYLVIGGLIATTSSLGFVYSDSYLVLFGLYLVTSIGSGAFHPSAASLIASMPSENKGTLVGIFTSGGAIGMAFSQIIFTYAYFNFEGQVAWLAMPAMLLITFLLFNRVGSKARLENAPKRHFDLQSIKSFFRQRELRMLYFTQLCGTTMFWALVFFLPDILVARGYESWVAFGAGHMAFVLGGALMMIPAGYLSDRYTAKRTIFISSALGMIMYYAFLVFPLLGNYPVLTLLFVMGAALGCINPVGLALATRLAPNHKGVVSGIMMGMVWCFSEALGQTGGGLLTKCFEDDAVAKALAVLGSLFLVGLITTTQLPEKETPLELANALE